MAQSETTTSPSLTTAAHFANAALLVAVEAGASDNVIDSLLEALRGLGANTQTETQSLLP